MAEHETGDLEVVSSKTPTWSIFFTKFTLCCVTADLSDNLTETCIMKDSIRVATAQGKTGNLVLTFSRQGKHREFCCNTGKIFLTVFINAKSMFLFTYFQKTF